MEEIILQPAHLNAHPNINHKLLKQRSTSKKHIEGISSNVGMKPIKGADRKLRMDSGLAYSQKELAFILKQKGNERFTPGSETLQLNTLAVTSTTQRIEKNIAERQIERVVEANKG